MSSHYCSAGGIDCKYINLYESHPDNFCSVGNTNIKHFEVCPYPSHQQPIAPAPNCQHLSAGDVESEASKTVIAKNIPCPDCGGSHKDRKAVKSIIGDNGIRYIVLAALSTAEIKGK